MTIDIDKERADFEVWALTDDGNCDRHDLRQYPVGSFERVTDGNTFISPRTERDWIVWQARASTPPSTEGALEGQAAGLPAVLFDGKAVYDEYKRVATHLRTSPENVSDVLDAVVRILKAEQAVEQDSSATCGGDTNQEGSFQSAPAMKEKTDVQGK